MHLYTSTFTIDFVSFVFLFLSPVCCVCLSIYFTMYIFASFVFVLSVFLFLSSVCIFVSSVFLLLSSACIFLLFLFLFVLLVFIFVLFASLFVLPVYIFALFVSLFLPISLCTVRCLFLHLFSSKSTYKTEVVFYCG
jgi:hypothetical protein